MSYLLINHVPFTRGSAPGRFVVADMATRGLATAKLITLDATHRKRAQLVASLQTKRASAA